MTVQITRRDQDATALRAAAARSGNAKVARRLLALAFVLDGCDRAEAARRCGMDRQTLRDWVIRYNQQGIAGLSDRPHAGGPSAKLTDEEKAQLAQWVRQGPNLAEDGVVQWRLGDLKERILGRFFVVMDERSVSRILKTMSFGHVSVRPRNPKANADAQEAHKKTLPTWCKRQSRQMRATNPSNCGGRCYEGGHGLGDRPN